MLEIVNKKYCENCGYDKCQAALEFHHNIVEDKKFNISSARSLNDDVLKELDKCQVLCSNCHRELHHDIKFYNDNYENIIMKSKNIIELQKTDHDVVIKMYVDDHKTITEIAKELKRNKSVVGTIIRNKGYGAKMENIKISCEIVLNLHNKGKTVPEISKIINCNKTTIYSILDKNGIFPNKCNKINKRKFDPSKEELEELLKTIKCNIIAKMYCVKSFR